ncbi:hypothetical protein BS50DRAFT_651004 [Corynespora cassiicola Philippines]|uniref:Cupin type-2 domain-containing protein n=1 Tax=Corynespora cassiicola Philippines TaxID=1448308 RepID=A0A2T2N992_CORCC|nr:hypothetical protein BS50DRAFT_651004 [Corynespora cassiicola Philippines]
MDLPKTNTAINGISKAELRMTNDKKQNIDVNFFFPAEENNFETSVVMIPPGSQFQAGSHWHEKYDEVILVIKGRLKVRVGKEYVIRTPEDGKIIIPPGITHNVMRADHGLPQDERDDEEVIIHEWSGPVDGSKDLFFRHLFSIEEDRHVFGWKAKLQLILTMMYTDNYIEIVPGPLSWYVTHGVYAVARPIAFALGLQPFYREYLPKRLDALAEKFYGGKLKLKQL